MDALMLFRTLAAPAAVRFLEIAWGALAAAGDTGGGCVSSPSGRSSVTGSDKLRFVASRFTSSGLGTDGARPRLDLLISELRRIPLLLAAAWLELLASEQGCGAVSRASRAPWQ